MTYSRTQSLVSSILRFYWVIINPFFKPLCCSRSQDTAAHANMPQFIASPSQGLAQTDRHIHAHIHTLGHFTAAKSLNLHVSGLWESKESMPAVHRKVSDDPCFQTATLKWATEPSYDASEQPTTHAVIVLGKFQFPSETEYFTVVPQLTRNGRPLLLTEPTLNCQRPLWMLQ